MQRTANNIGDVTRRGLLGNIAKPSGILLDNVKVSLNKTIL